MEIIPTENLTFEERFMGSFHFFTFEPFLFTFYLTVIFSPLKQKSPDGVQRLARPPLQGEQQHCQGRPPGAGTEIYELKWLSRVGSTSKLAPDWLHNQSKAMGQQILTQLLTMTPTHKSPL